MINIIKLDFVPRCVEWIYAAGDGVFTIAVTDEASNNIYIFDSQGTGKPLKVLDSIHSAPVVAMKVCKHFKS